MSLKVTPEHLPVISALLSTAQAAVAETVMSAAPASIVIPPAFDVVSAQLAPASYTHAAAFFPCALDGIGCGVQASEVLPVIAVDYLVTDVFGAGYVQERSVLSV